MIKQSSFDNWKPQYDYVDLCELKFTTGEFSKLYGIEFEVGVEEGLGDCYFSCVEVASKLYFLFGVPESDVVPGFVVRMEGNNPSVQISLAELTTALGVGPDRVGWVQDYFTEPKWALVRQGDDGNEIEIDRFHKQGVANHNMELFESRGHKQSYIVREVI